MSWYHYAACQAKDPELFFPIGTGRPALLKLEEAKLFRNYQEIGKTVSATIPIALRQAEEAGRLGPGRTVMLVGFGVGLSLADCLVRT